MSLLRSLITALALALVFGVVYSWGILGRAEPSTRSMQIEQALIELQRLLITHPKQAHLLTLIDRYQDVGAQVALSLRGTDDHERANLELEERAFADYIFTLFDHLVMERVRAAEARDESRARDADAMLRYFTEKLLRNPRLTYYWREDGAGLSATCSARTREYYERHVRDASANVMIDPKGPFRLDPTPQPFTRSGGAFSRPND
jgi:hypothetical protein